MYPAQEPNYNFLNQYVQVIEQILNDIGIPVQEARHTSQRGYGWHITKGSALIEIYLNEQANRGYFQVVSPLIHIPASGLLPLYRRLLELNLQIANAALGIYLDVVYIYHERPVEGLNLNEVNEIITSIAVYADDLDNQLVEEFGGRLYSSV
ncbi:hypothetical protein MASR2M15_28260 [Anaerolineales bacterium]